jgi:MFS family permease
VLGKKTHHLKSGYNDSIA